MNTSEQINLLNDNIKKKLNTTPSVQKKDYLNGDQG